uniref:Peptidoglycan-recognition protein n=1 Tax=Melanoplus sanguinipes TaxID=65742 RepID=A0A0U3SX80_MELSA|nr:peptidoglycan recognition protein SA [Melanoplus sanguinipes]
MAPHVAVLLLAVFAAANAQSSCPNIVSRLGWGAKPAKQVEYIIKPVGIVIVHHTVSPICTSMNACAERVRSIQVQHMNNLKFEDIGYSFLVGGDGNVYEGRGWHKQGAHTRGYNKNSIGIALIGDFTDSLPSRPQLKALEKLLDCGRELKELSEDYKLLGARQVVATQSPGLALYQEIQNWPAWVEQP